MNMDKKTSKAEHEELNRGTGKKNTDKKEE